MVYVGISKVVVKNRLREKVEQSRRIDSIDQHDTSFHSFLSHVKLLTLFSCLPLVGRGCLSSTQAKPLHAALSCDGARFNSNAVVPRNLVMSENSMIKSLHSRKLTWNLKMMVSNRNLLFQVSIFGCHVSFRECK